jgi:hypothetical protein
MQNPATTAAAALSLVFHPFYLSKLNPYEVI